MKEFRALISVRLTEDDRAAALQVAQEVATMICDHSQTNCAEVQAIEEVQEEPGDPSDSGLIRLSERDSETVAAALLAPPRDLRALRDAAKEYREAIESGRLISEE